MLVAAAAIVLVLLVGGLTQVSSQSKGYDTSSDRTLAAQGAVLADRSNATSKSVQALMGDLPTQTRQGLQAGLDDAVRQTEAQSQQATLASGSVPAGSPGAALAAVFAERAQSMQELRATLDGLLGIGPMSTPGAPITAASTVPGHGALLTSSQATDRITAAGALLSHSDALYRSVRRTLVSAGAGARLPRSVWVTDPLAWQSAHVAAQVDAVATSPTLVSSHYVVLRTVRLTPPALPTPQGGSSDMAVLSPVTQIGVTAVLANQGSEAQSEVHTTFTLADQGAGTTTTRTEVASIGLDGSVTLPTVAFAVRPGTTYVLTVQIVLPPGQTLTNGTVYQQALRVSPAT